MASRIDLPLSFLNRNVFYHLKPAQSDGENHCELCSVDRVYVIHCSLKKLAENMEISSSRSHTAQRVWEMISHIINVISLFPANLPH